MNSSWLRKKFLDFFIKKGHKVLPNLPLVPENDPTTLFISAGMQPLVPYLLGEPHPLGKRLCSLQRCLRTNDIEKIGDTSHLTFFEMLGNWSLGDYWKEEALSWSYEFLTKVLNLDPKRLYVTIFAGDENAPKDEEAEKIWQKLGIPSSRIFPLGKEDNWWEAGETGPGGPDSEIFYDTGKSPCGIYCRPGDGCGRFFEVWNNVFMEYNRKPDGTYEKLKQKNVDTGMGVERTGVVLQDKEDVFQIDVFLPLIEEIEQLSKKRYFENQKSFRIVADHLRAAVFLIADGVLPANIEQGYVLRRLIRRAIRFGKKLDLKEGFSSKIGKAVIATMKEEYPELKNKEESIDQVLTTEEEKFYRLLEKGLRQIEKYSTLDGKIAFWLYETYGIPLEMTEEIAQERGQVIDKEVFEREFRKHQEISRQGGVKKFKGGLADHSPEVIKLHTATHLLQAALRLVLGTHIRQVGSNITPQRLRFDFIHPQPLTKEEIKKVEEIINQKIKENLPVTMKITTLSEAKKEGALAFFGDRYSEKVKVYTIGEEGNYFSKEVCGGPHVNSTGEIGGVKIVKEESAGAGKRRIYAVLNYGNQ
ncbi:MAG: alanine--tRNA ligase [Microgenomates group bacterium]